MSTRRGLLGGLLGVLAAATLPRAARPAAAAPAAAPGGTLDVKAWRWTTLPGTGAELYSTRAVAVTYAADGTVTAPLSLAPPPPGSAQGEQRIAVGPGYGVTLRRTL